MSALVAIELTSQRATLVAAQPTAEGTFEVQAIRSVDRELILANSSQHSENSSPDSTLSPSTAPEKESAGDSVSAPQDSSSTLAPSAQDSGEATAPESEKTTPTESGEASLQRVLELVDFELDSSLAVLGESAALYESFTVPFRDQKKIDQIAPLQVQDLLPFEIDNFVLDNQLTSAPNASEHRVMTSILPEKEVEESLASLRSLGADPKILTTTPSVILALADLFPEDLSGTFGVILAGAHSCSLAFFVENSLRFLREFQVLRSDGSRDPQLYPSLRASIARTERDCGVMFERLYGLGSFEQLRELELALSTAIHPLDVSHLIKNIAELPVEQHQIAWAIALFAQEVGKKKLAHGRLVDFRRGIFAYKPSLRGLIEALQQELRWFFLCGLCALTYAGICWYDVSTRLSDVNNEIRQLVSQALPGETVIAGAEISSLQAKVSTLEEQLRKVGSLSSLSPLKALRELSKAIPGDMNVEIEATTITESSLSFSGTVPDVVVGSRLESVLQANKSVFCGVKLNTGDQMPGSNRLNFTCEISLCER